MLYENDRGQTKFAGSVAESGLIQINLQRVSLRFVSCEIPGQMGSALAATERALRVLRATRFGAHGKSRSAPHRRLFASTMRRHFNRSIGVIGLALNFAVVVTSNCVAMEFSRIPGCFGDVLKLKGDIRDGDFVHFRGHLGTERRIVGLDLDSGGGSLDEGFRIAMLARQKQIATYVSGECDSACAFIFLASRKRYVAPNAKIGVHSVSNLHGNEDNGTIRDTIKLARLSAKLRIPPSAVGRMVMTPPGKIYYLNKEELASLRVIERNPFDHIARAAEAQSKGNAVCGTGPSKNAADEGRAMGKAAGSKGS